MCIRDSFPAGSFPGQDKPLADDTHFSAYGAYELAKCFSRFYEASHILNEPDEARRGSLLSLTRMAFSQMQLLLTTIGITPGGLGVTEVAPSVVLVGWGADPGGAAAGLVLCGLSPDGSLVEMVELPSSQHPYFIGCQFHPEFKSRPTAPHPLFTAFVGAALEHLSLIHISEPTRPY